MNERSVQKNEAKTGKIFLCPNFSLIPPLIFKYWLKWRFSLAAIASFFFQTYQGRNLLISRLERYSYFCTCITFFVLQNRHIYVRHIKVHCLCYNRRLLLYYYATVFSKTARFFPNRSVSQAPWNDYIFSYFYKLLYILVLLYNISSVLALHSTIS